VKRARDRSAYLHLALYKALNAVNAAGKSNRLHASRDIKLPCPFQKGMYRRNMSVVSDRNTTLLKRPSRIYRAALSTITCLELGDGVAAQLATQVVLALVVI
jgi:hypothetical protein